MKWYRLTAAAQLVGIGDRIIGRFGVPLWCCASAIAHRFFTADLALRMQREDARLMADILWAMFKQKVLAYPIHDSVIVPTQHRTNKHINKGVIVGQAPGLDLGFLGL